MDTPSARDGDEQELLPCPFCNGKAEFGVADDGVNDGGEFIQCTELRCGVSSRLFFPSKMDVKPLLVEVWNRRPVHRDAEGACGVAEAIALLERCYDCGHGDNHVAKAKQALSAAPGVCSHAEDLAIEKGLNADLREVYADSVKTENELRDQIAALQAELAEAKQVMRDAVETYEHAFPTRPFDAGPPEQRFAMLLGELRDERDQAQRDIDYWKKEVSRLRGIIRRRTS